VCAIHNQCSNAELVSPVHFGNSAVCPKLFGQQIDIGTKMNVSFEINAIRDVFERALLFKLQRCSDGQHNMDTLITEVDKDESTHVYMLVAWKVKVSRPFVRVVLVKHTK
jgi:vacuolar-type H+-ATPase catalytic subunit A/Vma1